MSGKTVSFGKPPVSASARVEGWIKKREMDARGSLLLAAAQGQIRALN